MTNPQETSETPKRQPNDGSESRSNLITRREMLRLSALGSAALLTAGLWPGALRAMSEHPSSDFHFIVINDFHYRDERCGVWGEKVVASIRSLTAKPDFCVLAGDISENGNAHQLASARDVFSALPMPVRYIIGNHDYLANDDRKPFTQAFGKDLNRHFEHNGWNFLTLDTTEGRTVYRTNIADDTLHWLDKTLPRIGRKNPIIISTHFPLGWNLLRPLNVSALLDRFRDYNLQAVYSGHWHGISEHRVLRHTGAVTDRCCSWWRTNQDFSPHKGYFLCRIRGGHSEHKFIAVS